MNKKLKPIKENLDYAAALLEVAGSAWTDSDSKESLSTVNRRVARGLSNNPVFNATAYLKHCYGPLYTGEEAEGWLETILDIRAILKEKKNAK